MRAGTNKRSHTSGFVCNIPVNAKALTASSSARAPREKRSDREAKGTPNRAPNPSLFLMRIVRKCCAFAIGLDPHFAHAPQHIIDTAHMGRERPRLATSGPRLRPGAGSLTPHSRWTPALGRSRAAQGAARSVDGDLAKGMMSKDLQSAASPAESSRWRGVTR